MKLHRFLGSILYEEKFYEDINVKFLVHKDLINENTRNMILKYMESGITLNGVHVSIAYDIICFQPLDGERNPFMEQNHNYLWFAL